MKDTLKDIIEHTSALGFIDLIKVAGTDKETVITAVAEDRSVIVTGTLKAPNAEFIGTFGMPNLSKLKTILSFDDYDDESIITVNKTNATDPDQPTIIRFETKDKSFINDYRLMGKTIVEEKVKSVIFKGAAWNVEVEPTVAGIQRLKKQSQANSEEKHFTTKVDNGDLKIFFGDPSTHNGNFVFHSGVTGQLNKPWQWPVSQVISILSLPGDKTFKISDQGATEITVDSGLSVYQYLIPAQAK
jgi:hypothetical protein